MPELLNIDQTAKYLGMSWETVRDAMDAGQIPWVRIGTRRVVSKEALDKMLAEGKKTNE